MSWLEIADAGHRSQRPWLDRGHCRQHRPVDGALTPPLYTMIVAMAVVTTMVMPPSLRWMMARLRWAKRNCQRLDKEDAEQSESVPHMERTLVYLDDSVNGVVMASLAGLVRRPAGRADDGSRGTGARRRRGPRLGPPDGRRQRRRCASSPGRPLQQLVQARAAGADDALEKEALKGYSIAFVGIDQPISLSEPRFDERLERLVSTFDGPVAMLVNWRSPRPLGRPRRAISWCRPPGNPNRASLPKSHWPWPPPPAAA